MAEDEKLVPADRDHNQSSQTSHTFEKAGRKSADYSFEKERTKSFASWQVYFPVDPVRLAKSGFYYSGTEDEVVCFSCNGHIKNWNYGDVVQKKHSDLFPNCDFVNNRSNNVPFSQSKRSKDDIKDIKGPDFDCDRPTQVSQVKSTFDYNALKSLHERLLTFTADWPLSCIDVVKMAQAGFFYLGFKDKVQCPFCKGIVSNWEAADVPLKEHMKHFPWCSYLSGISSETSQNALPWYQVNSEDLCGNMKRQDLTLSKQKLIDKSQEHMDLRKLGVHLHSAPAHPQQASLNARIRSFLAWPASYPVDKEDLSKAGFFYIGINDHTKCYHCNGGLCNWERGDDPWVEHARWFRNCDFLQLMKGEAFIESCLKKYSSPSSEINNSEQLPSCIASEILMTKVDVAMKSELVKQVLESKLFPPYIVRAAILRQLKETGASFSAMEELTVAVSYLKEEMEKGQLNMHLQEEIGKDPFKLNIYKPSDLNIHDIDLKQCSISLDNHHMNVGSNLCALEQSSAEFSKIHSKVSQDEDRVYKDQCLCKICMDKELGVVFLPCGHFLACTECAPALKICPLCRKTIQATVRAFLP